jgi:hypothetical protein
MLKMSWNVPQNLPLKLVYEYCIFTLYIYNILYIYIWLFSYLSTTIMFIRLAWQFHRWSTFPSQSHPVVKGRWSGTWLVDVPSARTMVGNWEVTPWTWWLKYGLTIEIHDVFITWKWILSKFITLNFSIHGFAIEIDFLVVSRSIHYYRLGIDGSHDGTHGIQMEVSFAGKIHLFRSMGHGLKPWLCNKYITRG